MLPLGAAGSLIQQVSLGQSPGRAACRRFAPWPADGAETAGANLLLFPRPHARLW